MKIGAVVLKMWAIDCSGLVDFVREKPGSSRRLYRYVAPLRVTNVVSHYRPKTPFTRYNRY